MQTVGNYLKSGREAKKISLFLAAIGKDCTLIYFTKNMGLQLMVTCLFIGLVGFCGLFITTPALSDSSVADEIISLNVTNRPLGEVLESISIAADCQFSIDESWEDYPITVSFDSEPLYRGLKLIFRGINNAVIYGEDSIIKIIIYDEGTPSGKENGHSVTIKSSQEPIQLPHLSGAATAPQPEVEVSDDISDAENVEQLPEEIAEPDSDKNEAGDDEPSEEEKNPAEGGEESESAPDSSEKAENNESNEETSEN